VLSIDPITAVSLTNVIPRNDELQKYLTAGPGQVPWAEQNRFDSFTVISQTYQDIGSEPTLVIEAQAEAIADL
jgi:hypothetical protein